MNKLLSAGKLFINADFFIKLRAQHTTAKE